MAYDIITLYEWVRMWTFWLSSRVFLNETVPHDPGFWPSYIVWHKRTYFNNSIAAWCPMSWVGLDGPGVEIREPVEIRAIPVAVSADACILGEIRSLGKPEKAGYRRRRLSPLRCAEPEYRPCENPERIPEMG